MITLHFFQSQRHTTNSGPIKRIPLIGKRINLSIFASDPCRTFKFMFLWLHYCSASYRFCRFIRIAPRLDIRFYLSIVYCRQIGSFCLETHYVDGRRGGNRNRQKDRRLHLLTSDLNLCFQSGTTNIDISSRNAPQIFYNEQVSFQQTVIVFLGNHTDLIYHLSFFHKASVKFETIVRESIFI